MPARPRATEAANPERENNSTAKPLPEGLEEDGDEAETSAQGGRASQLDGQSVNVDQPEPHEADDQKHDAENHSHSLTYNVADACGETLLESARRKQRRPLTIY